MTRAAEWRSAGALAAAALLGGAAGAPPPLSSDSVARVAQAAGFAGEIAIARGAAVTDHAYGSVAPGGGALHKAGERWRLASVTKQVTALLVMQAVAGGRLSLDAPVAPILGRPALGTLTVRQLLTHHSGLPNPDSTPAGAGGVPGFYLADAPNVGFCLSPARAPGGDFQYNNCDYLVLGAMLERVERRSFARLVAGVPGGFRVPAGGAGEVPGFVGGRPEPAIRIATFGAAGALGGTAAGLLRFDRALLAGALLPGRARDTMWTPEAGSYQALGQWVFPGRLGGCAGPKRIVQRDGEIEGVQVRNFILPDDGLSLVLLTNRSADDFPLGEVWEGKGFVFDLLSAAVCR